MKTRIIKTKVGNYWIKNDEQFFIVGSDAALRKKTLKSYEARFESMIKQGYGQQTEVDTEYFNKWPKSGQELLNNLKEAIKNNPIKKSETMKSEETKQTEKQVMKTTEDQKEFVIEVTAFDIKNEIINATKEYVAQNCDDTFEKELNKVVEKAVQKLAPNYIKVGEREQVKIEGRTHKAFEDCAFLAQHQRQIFISGPAGSGKTTLGEQIAKAFKLNFSFMSCSAGMSEAHLLGRMLFDGTYVASDFVTTYETGGVFLLDEVDAADANTLLTINSALANGIISIPNRKEQPHAKRHADFILIASANTWGAGSYEYHGRNHLDAAFLDRFAMSRVFIDYDKQVEKEYCSEVPELAKRLWEIRKACEKNKVRKIVSTRAFKEGAIQMKAGKTLEQVIERFVTGWTEEEKSKVLKQEPEVQPA